MPQGSSPAIIYYGWVILLVAAIAEMLATGATSYAAGLFVIPLQAEFSLSRADANSSILIVFVGAALVAPFVGKLLDRYSIRWIVSLGALALGLAFTVIAFTSSLLLMAVMLFLFVSVGFTALSTLTATTMLSRWFYRKRGLALGIGVVATSGGGLFVVPILSKAIEAYGWRTALLLEGVCITVIVVVLAIFLLRDSPKDLGLEGHPENTGRPADDFLSLSKTAKTAPTWPWKSIVKEGNFWIAAIAMAMTAGISQALVISFVPYGIQLGFTPASAAGIISAFSIAAALTKIAGGLLADYINKRAILVFAMFSMAASLVFLVTLFSYWSVLASALLAGMALGCVLPTSAAIIAASFGAPSFGTVMGLSYAIMGAFLIFAVRAVGAIYDSTQSYQIAFSAFIPMVIIAAIVIFTIGGKSRDLPAS